MHTGPSSTERGSRSRTAGTRLASHSGVRLRILHRHGPEEREHPAAEAAALDGARLPETARIKQSKRSKRPDCAVKHWPEASMRARNRRRNGTDQAEFVVMTDASNQVRGRGHSNSCALRRFIRRPACRIHCPPAAVLPGGRQVFSGLRRPESRSTIAGIRLPGSIGRRNQAATPCRRAAPSAKVIRPSSVTDRGSGSEIAPMNRPSRSSCRKPMKTRPSSESIILPQ